MQRLLTFARYGARIDKNIGRALEVLRVLRDRPDACMDGLKKCTSKPEAELTAQIRGIMEQTHQALRLSK